MYEKQQWEDLPVLDTALEAARLRHLETQYDEAVAYTDDAVAEVRADMDGLIGGAVIARPGAKFRAVGCTIRNTGAGWALIQDAGHEPIGVSGVSVSGGFIRIALDFVATKVGTAIVKADETFVIAGIDAGPSVALDTISLQLGKIGGCYDYVAWNGTAWTFSTGFVTGVAINATTGVITFTHEEVTEALGGVVEMRTDGTNRVAAGGRTATTMQATVFPYNSATSLKAPTTDMRFFITRPGVRKIADPTTVVSASGNFWVEGIFQVAA